MHGQNVVRISLELPQFAVEAFRNLADSLCRQRQSTEREDWVVSPPLPAESRVGRLLRAARFRAEMTQAELAAKIRVPQTHISQYERNKRKIPLQKAELLAEILHTSKEHFLP